MFLSPRDKAITGGASVKPEKEADDCFAHFGNL